MRISDWSSDVCSSDLPDRDKPSQPTEMHEALLCGIGRLIFSWGKLEVHLEQKVAQLRQNAGDVRATARIRPTMAKMLAELRAIVSMRNRRNNMQLVEIAEIERTIQRIDKFRMLVIQGFQAPAEEQNGSDNSPLLCLDAKNNIICISLDDLEQEVSRLDN